MRLKISLQKINFKNTACSLFIIVLLSGCSQVKNIFTYPKKNIYQHNKPFLYQTSIELKGGIFTGEERKNIEQRLYTQLDDSSRVTVNDKFFIFHPIINPPAFDTSQSNRSATNMKNYLLHLGYYSAKDSIVFDTLLWNKQQRVTVKYLINAGIPTLIDTFRYLLKKPNLQAIALQTAKSSFIVQNQPITKLDVLSEISRLVDTFRNNGYYKFTSDELKMRGDSTIEALTNMSDDPLENLQLLEEANEQRNKPTVKLALLLNPSADSTRLKQYYINNIYIYPDYYPEDASGVANFNETKDMAGNIIRFHKIIILNGFLMQNLYLKKGNLYRQEEYTKTVNSFARLGVWQNVNIQLKEKKDSTGLLDVYIQLLPAKKYGFEATIEASYSANSNSNNVSVANAGNLLGGSFNMSLQNRNVWKRGIKMTNSIRAGAELNLNAVRGSGQNINSNEFSFNNTISIPKIVPPYISTALRFMRLYNEEKTNSQQTFFNSSFANTNRIGLFKLNSFGFNMGYEFSRKDNKTFTFKPLNIEYTNLYDRSKIFDSTLQANPFLRYSFNTALVIGWSAGYTESHISVKNRNKISALRANLEVSGFMFPFIPIGEISFIKKDLRKFIKLDLEKTFNHSYLKSTTAMRLFAGIGVPIGSSDTTLPFFKQYFAGGSNSMRAWPIRGLGPGSKPLATYNSRSFADRTGDIRLEANFEYRRTLFQIIPNSIVLKYALFTDVGNIWNFKNTIAGGGYDSAQFKLNLNDFYKELGVTAGAGLRFDFNFVLIRVDFGFRIKRPELGINGGWKLPSIGFNDLFGKIFTSGVDDEYRKWRYENFNFSVGLSYPF